MFKTAEPLTGADGTPSGTAAGFTGTVAKLDFLRPHLTNRLPTRTAATLALAAMVLLAAWIPANAAAGPAPLPNPDRAFVTPVMTGPYATGNESANANGSGVRSGGPRTAGISASRICPKLRRLARSGNSRPALQVRNMKSGKVVCGLNAKAPRILASNTKIFTTVTALGRLGAKHRLRTRVYAKGRVNRKGVLRGNLFLVGGGDPAFGSNAFLSRYFGGAGSSLEQLAKKVRRAGIRKVNGHLIGDDTWFDRLRGVADSGYATSSWIGPLSGLSFNAGYTSSSLSNFSSNPARLATKTFATALRARGIKLKAGVGLRPMPRSARRNLVARQIAPNMAWMARITNLNSNNFFAEMLLKNIGALTRGSGTTAAGATAVRRYSKRQMGAAVNPVDGSGLTRSNRSTAAGLVRLLTRTYRKRFRQPFINSLPVAGRDGTLAGRMRGSSAEGNCHAKTGTLTGVSTLSGYCLNKSGRKFAFSILMNSVGNSYSARIGQDRIAALIARF